MKAYIAALTLALCACATVGRDVDMMALDRIPVGASKAQVVSMIGQPTGTTRLADGTSQLMWSYGSSKLLGRTTGKAVILGFDADGNYTGVVSASETTVN